MRLKQAVMGKAGGEQRQKGADRHQRGFDRVVVHVGVPQRLEMGARDEKNRRVQSPNTSQAPGWPVLIQIKAAITFLAEKLRPMDRNRCQERKRP